MTGNAAVVIVTMVDLLVSKVGSGWLGMRVSGFTNKKGICAGLMTVPQLSATLAAATVALQLQMIGPEFFNAIVCLSVATTIPVPTLVKLLILKGRMQFDQVEDQLKGVLPTDELDEDLVRTVCRDGVCASSAGGPACGVVAIGATCERCHRGRRSKALSLAGDSL